MDEIINFDEWSVVSLQFVKNNFSFWLSLRSLPILFILEVRWLVSFWRIQKTESFASVLLVSSMMNIMSVDHPSQVFTLTARSPPHSLMNNDVVKNKIKYAVTNYTKGDRQHIGIVHKNGAVVEKQDGRNAEHHTEPVVLLESVIMDSVM